MFETLTYITKLFLPFYSGLVGLTGPIGPPGLPGDKGEPGLDGLPGQQVNIKKNKVVFSTTLGKYF